MSQQMEALAIANTIRIQGVVVRQELRAEVITLAEALSDERAGHLPINRLLCSMRRWTPVRSDTLLMRVQIWPSKRVDTLTERQRSLIVEAVSR